MRHRSLTPPFDRQYIAKKLLEINERGTYVDPDSIPTSDPERSNKLLAQEEELFQVARLINCAWFGSAIFSDYFSAILGLVRQGSSWSLNPFGVSRIVTIMCMSAHPRTGNQEGGSYSV